MNPAYRRKGWSAFVRKTMTPMPESVSIVFSQLYSGTLVCPLVCRHRFQRRCLKCTSKIDLNIFPEDQIKLQQSIRGLNGLFSVLAFDRELTLIFALQSAPAKRESRG